MAAQLDLDEPASVLLVRARVGLGDLLCSGPAVRASRARLPRARIAILTYREVHPVLARLHPEGIERLAMPGWPGIPERPVDAAAILGFLDALRAEGFDLALQAHGANAAANALTEAAGARRTGGFFVPGSLATAPDLGAHLPYPQHVHEVRRHLALMEHLGAPSVGEALDVPLGAADEAEAAALGLPRPYALLHPGATSQSRRWPLARFAAVGDALAAQGLAVAVSGVAGEERATAAVISAMRAPAIDLCNRTGLGGYTALLRDAALLVGNDTGSAHLAAAVGTPSVTLFLSGDPVRWSYADPRHVAAREAVECNPCPHLTCPIDHRCADRLTVARVLDACRVASVA